MLVPSTLELLWMCILSFAVGPSCYGFRPGQLIVGAVKYSHDAAICIVDEQGEILFAQQKERLTRAKHDGGDVSVVVEQGLEAIGAQLEHVGCVVANNHHFRIHPFEQPSRLAWSVAEGHYPLSYTADSNLVPGAEQVELSHHLAHAWSVVSQAPFEDGVVVVMDGMGESHSAMARAREEDEKDYHHDLDVPEAFTQIPSKLLEGSAYREGESAYLFDEAGVRPYYKRWIRERSPPELFNHGFENMESLGAVYSRISSHIFGDWNSCGKVMGLAPWARKWGRGTGRGKGLLDKDAWLMRGDLMLDELDQKEEKGAFEVNWDLIERLPHPNQLHDPELQPYYAQLASLVQSELETCALQFLRQLREKTGAKNLCLCGGVALNSSLNGRIVRESGYERVYIPCHPGDEGIAIGCAAYGLNLLNQSAKPGQIFKLGSGLRLPYTGKAWSNAEVQEELERWEPWVRIKQMPTESMLLEDTARCISEGGVVAWFQGHSEYGPRALGCRSMLADPSDESKVNFINARIKLREDFRPFAPSVLAEHSQDWFEALPPLGSPYMSITAKVKESKRALIPAVVHTDGTSRLQTVDATANPRYHRLLTAFYDLSGVPMLLNTSLNVKAPIVDSPADALDTFLGSHGSLDMLVLADLGVLVTAKLNPFTPQDGLGLTMSDVGDYKVSSVLDTGFLSEVMARETSKVVRVRIMDVRGTWVELGGLLELEVLEALAEANAPERAMRVTELASCLEMAGEEEEQLLVKALENLYKMRLISSLN
ncbi:unnamed protein product [Chrysoparadoxa australica]